MILPDNGQRFTLMGTEYEINFIGSGVIRYSNVIGGKIAELNIEKFQELLSNEIITLDEKHDDSFPSVDKLTDDEKKLVYRRLQYVRAVLKITDYPRSKLALPVIKNIADELDDKNPPSLRTCGRWVTNYVQTQRNPMSLVPRFNNSGNRKTKFSANIWRIISDRVNSDYLTLQRLSITAVYAYIIGEITDEYNKGIISIEDYKTLPSYQTVYRYINTIDPYKRSRSRHGKYNANRLFKAAGAGSYSTRILETVEADGNILDVLVVDPDTGEIIGRPYGTCIIDQYSRCILAFVITMIPFSAATILEAVKIAVTDSNRFSGLFETLLVDNGSDYISHSLKNCCLQIGANISYAKPRSPDDKARVERWFKTFNSQFCHTLPGTTFSNPSHKDDYPSSKYASFTLDELIKCSKIYINNVYHCAKHTGIGRIPAELWRESSKKHPVHTYSMEQMDKIARNVHVCTISKGRVTFLYLKWFSHRLASIEQELRAKNKPCTVHIYVDYLNLNRVYVIVPGHESESIWADSTKPEFTKNLTLYEYRIFLKKLKNKGLKDIESLGENYLMIQKWELWKEICTYSSEYSKKQIARLKEATKKSNVKENNPALPPKKTEVENLDTSLLQDESTDLSSYLPPDENHCPLHNDASYEFEDL